MAAGGIDISQSLPVYEAGDTRQFTMTATMTVPTTAAFIVYDTIGNSLALNAIERHRQHGNSTRHCPTGFKLEKLHGHAASPKR